MKVAVYGTLREGGSNEVTMKKIGKKVGMYRTLPVFKMHSLNDDGFPGIKRGGTTSVLMEVYDVDLEDIKEVLDVLEHYKGRDNPHNMYNREIIDTPYGRAFTYFYNAKFVDGQDKVENGDWLDFKSTKLINGYV